MIIFEPEHTHHPQSLSQRKSASSGFRRRHRLWTQLRKDGTMPCIKDVAQQDGISWTSMGSTRGAKKPTNELSMCMYVFSTTHQELLIYVV